MHYTQAMCTRDYTKDIYWFDMALVWSFSFLFDTKYWVILQ